MKVTYISHSGFLIETKNCLFLFDYYEGKIPPLSQEKPLFIFVSHWHSDHFNPEIFSIRHEKVHYILSHDTRKHLPAGISQENLCFMKPEEKLDFTLEDTKPLENLDIWAAFLPLDPRQEEWYSKGFLHILEHAHVKYAFPMHFWKDYSVISGFLSSPEGSKYQKTVVNIEQEGQEFSL